MLPRRELKALKSSRDETRVRSAAFGFPEKNYHEYVLRKAPCGRLGTVPLSSDPHRRAAAEVCEMRRKDDMYPSWSER